MVNYISDQVLKTTIYVSPTQFTKNVVQTILKQLKQKVEKKCNNIGYVIENSSQIIKKSMGVVNSQNNIARIKFNISYRCQIISPSVGDEMECYVNSINKMGVIGYIKLNEIVESSDLKIQDITTSPLIIIIPDNRIKDRDAINVGDKIKIKINAIRNKFNEDKIQIVGTNNY
jgi:DNA-directed RNA polymerase subunit E'/Rpb7